ncbi:MAG: putative membrane protein [Candidatus Methanohalarchaeum thermophilum]|uniref:Membrane protein n=1 Tax=Methanohalarchaeum thermophilum TaxID=1903181 RepID=A0A1Q6DTX9_METT1|nr:MAG: putative membrane protein [Candidatus Methanohalarchaeum thermophilum]
MVAIIESEIFSLILLPALIFLARVIDVSMATLRTILVVRGIKILSALIGFFEILIWLSAITQIMANLNDPTNYIAYAGGFATGNYIGIWIENKIAIGYQLIRAITTEKADDIINKLQKEDYKLTRSKAITNGKQVDILYIPVKRKELSNVLKIIRNHDPEAIYTIQDIKALSKEALPSKPITKKNKTKVFDHKRKGK